MKKIIDFFVAAYFSTVYKKYEDRLGNALFLLEISFAINGLSLFFCSIPLFCSLPYVGKHIKLSSSFAYGAIIFLVFMLITYIVKHFLEKYYSQQYDYIKAYSEKIPRVLSILFVIVHYLGSAFLGLFCMKYTLCLKP